MDDADLVRRVREGDSSAFSTLYQTHAALVFHVVRSAAGSSDAADLVQEVFVRALERLDSLQSPDRFRPWLLSIARNASTDSLRARARRDVTTPDDSLDLADPARGPDEASELAELTALVRGAVAGLTPRDAAAVTMVTQFGYSIDEVATIFGVSHGAAKVLLHRARRRLRDALALEVLVHRRTPGCRELQDMGPDDVLNAGRHIRSCAACLSAAGREVQVYSWPPSPPVASPTTVIPASRSATPNEAARESGDQSTTPNPVTSGFVP